MSEFIKKKAKDTADLSSKAIGKSLSFILNDVVLEIMDELGVSMVTKAKITNTGLKMIRKMGIKNKGIQREILKNSIKKELRLK